MLSATSDAGDLPTLERAAGRLGIDLSALAAAESAGLVALHPGQVEFRHPLARSAIYADASASQRREAHRALAAALPDRDIDRRAWHLAAAAAGTDETASAALEQAGARSRDRSANATATAAFERAGRLTADGDWRARLLREAAGAGWLAGFTDRAVALLEEARDATGDPVTLVEIDQLIAELDALEAVPLAVKQRAGQVVKEPWDEPQHLAYLGPGVCSHSHLPSSAPVIGFRARPGTRQAIFRVWIIDVEPMEMTRRTHTPGFLDGAHDVPPRTGFWASVTSGWPLSLPGAT